MSQMRAFMDTMKHSPLHNYGGIPGVTSWLIGAPADDGSKVRLLECSRNHTEPIVPHSHRFAFQCHVLAGSVRQELWGVYPSGEKPGQYAEVELTYGGEPGKYQMQALAINRWSMAANVYTEGDVYSMEAEEVHSIWFTEGTAVLFLEGPQLAAKSIILQPVVDGAIVPTFHVAPWAFRGQP